MDAGLKAKWVEALRSGHFTQCRFTLEEDGGGFCCLGVLCKISDRRTHGDAIDDSYRWAQDITGRHYQKLIELNDGERLPFPKIADYIQVNL